MNSILKDVSISEMLHMREEGMSNCEIANAVGVSYASILRFIGKQPSEMRKNVKSTREKAYKCVTKQPAKIPETLPAPCVRVVQRTVTLEGELGKYFITSGSIGTTIEDGCIVIPPDKLGTLINELQAIQNNLRVDTMLSTEPEVW